MEPALVPDARAFLQLLLENRSRLRIPISSPQDVQDLRCATDCMYGIQPNALLTRSPREMPAGNRAHSMP